MDNFKQFSLSTKESHYVFGGTSDDGITNGHCTPDPLGDAIRQG